MIRVHDLNDMFIQIVGLEELMFADMWLISCLIPLRLGFDDLVDDMFFFGYRVVSIRIVSIALSV